MPMELEATLIFLERQCGFDFAMDSSIRAWSAGSAKSQEHYTLAMVLAEIMGLEAYRRRVKIHAADLDLNALARARRARYDFQALESFLKLLRAKYFESDEAVSWFPARCG